MLVAAPPACSYKMIPLPGNLSPGDRVLLEQAASVDELSSLADCTARAIQHFSRRHGINLATALLYDRVLRIPANRDIFTAAVRDSGPSTKRLPLIGLVPGAFYQHHRHSGADGAVLAAMLTEMGCRIERVPIDSFGPLETNAEKVGAWLEQHAGEEVALVSLSKGTCDVNFALRHPKAASHFRHVRAWLSISGLPLGTPLVAWLGQRPFRRCGVKILLRLRRQNYAVVEQLSHQNPALITNWEFLPGHMRVVHVVGFPLRHHLTHRWAPRAYKRLSTLGPNDGGGFLLADVNRIPGAVMPIWGADHYLRPAWDIQKLLRGIFLAVLAPK